MAPSVLGLGVPASSPLVPDHLREPLGKALENLEAQMNASPYDWEFLDVGPDMDFEVLVRKLREKKWDAVMVGMGLRTMNDITPFFERIINTIHKQLPDAKFAFNAAIDKTLEACKRVLEEP
ncbi:hypothetical protein SCAR479_03165 [Seiridium cardinale]|uniref:B12-binding domain-containing protein n=1 Tax=Seiridium cardinale TaxID=138064 RepID=A0ABR2Y1X3_9PEZI